MRSATLGLGLGGLWLGFLGAVLALAPRAEAQACGCPPGNICPENPIPLPYTGDIEPHCRQTYRVFLPDPAIAGPRPPDGWPALIYFDLGGYFHSGDARCAPLDSIAGKVLLRGIAFIAATATVSSEPGAWPADCTSVPPGHGMFHPPGALVSADGGEPVTPFEPYAQPDWSMPEKDAVMIIQHVRCYAGDVEDPGGWKLGEIDRHKLAVYGRSAGAVAMMWAALGPDRRNELPFAAMSDPQFDMPTRPDYAVLRAGTIWWPLFDPAFDPALPTVTHFSAGGDATLPAEAFGQALPADLQGASPLAYEECMFNAQLPLFMTYGEVSQCVDTVGTPFPAGPGPCGYSWCFTGGGLEGLLHPTWGGYTWTRRYPELTRLVVTTAAAFAQKPPEVAAELLEVMTPAQQSALDTLIADWLREQMDAPFEPWKVITQARPAGDVLPSDVTVAGVSGVPTLAGSGSPVPGDTLTIQLTNARPDATAYLAIGISTLAQPAGLLNSHVAGGIFVPYPHHLVTLVTDATGSLVLSAPVTDVLPPFTQTWYQVWIVDPAAVHGFASTNALLLTVP